jgi:hypothetical protein
VADIVADDLAEADKAKWGRHVDQIEAIRAMIR